MLKEKILSYIASIIFQELSPKKVALAISLSAYIAFSPYIFFHTILVFILAWIFQLNSMVMLGVTYAINNPFTMVPIFAVDYFVGDFLLCMLCGQGAFLLNPAFMEYINGPLRIHTGIEGISFWSFMLGGNLLGILFGVILYPIIKHLCENIMRSVKV